MKFFIDNNLPQQLANGLKGFGENVMHLTEQFPPDTEDVGWLTYVGSLELILVTRDERIRHNPFELKSLREHKVGAFFLGGKNRKRCDLIQQIVRNWPRMKELASKTDRPFAFRIPPTGSKIVSIPL
jgi:predicted nuclease of predicted toxin-antitoxin system